MTAHKRRDGDLVRRSRRGDRAAFAELVRTYENAAYATALTYVRSREDAQDIVQEAFVTAYCKLVQLREPENFGSWLWTIVRRHALEWLRRARTLQFAADTTETMSEVSAEEFATTRRNADLWDAVCALPEELREVVLTYYLNDFSYEQVADYLGLTAPTVKGRLHRSRARLKEELSSEETEELSMNRVHVGKKVEEAICKIASEELHETVSLGDTRHVVLFCGLPGDIEVCHTEGDEVVVTGTKTSLGFTEEEAKQSVAGIKVYWDRVEDFLEAGPHEGELFFTTFTEEGKPTGKGFSVRERWSRLTERQFRTAFEHGDLYPELATRDEDIVRTVKDSLRKVTSITVIRERMQDIHVPREAYTEAIQRVFAANLVSDEEAHGPRGSVQLVVAVPTGTHVTVLQGTWLGWHVRAWGLRSNVNIVNCRNVELEDIEGDVCLLNTSVRKASGIRGRILQSHYDFSGTDWSNYETTRAIPDSTFEDITGELRSDLLKTNLEVSGITGRLDVRNRFGTTRFHANAHETGSKYRIESDSGDVLLFLKESLLGEMTLTVNTLCGVIKHEALKGSLYSGGPFLGRNDLQLITVSTIPNLSADQLEADLLVRTRDGNVTIEKTK